jgi:hypothetical protein
MTFERPWEAICSTCRLAWRRFESRRRLSVKASIALIATGLALAAAGCSLSDDDEEAAEDRAAQSRVPPKLVDATVVEGGRRRERELLTRVVRGMGKTALTRVEIGPLDGRRETDGATAVPVTFTPVPGPSVRRQWEEWIVAGAFSRRLRAADLPAEVDGADRDASFTARPRVRRQPDPKPLSRRQEAALVDGIRGAARRSGGDVVALEVHRPYGVAVALSLGADEPASFLQSKLRPLMERLDGYRPRLEGMYLAVLDERRRLVLEWGSWTRNPAGSYWVRRDLANCSPIRQSEPPGAEPSPPCPA